MPSGSRHYACGIAPPKPPIDPIVWHPAPAPERAKRKHGPEPFPEARRIPVSGSGPEDVVVDSRGNLLCGVEDGRILRLTLGGDESTVADTGGRPLGLEVEADGRVLVCDARRGLLRLDPSSGALDVLVGEIGGVPLRFCSNAAAMKDGTIWFTEATSRFDPETYRGDFLEHRGAGRLMRRDTDGTVDVVLDGLHFANGVALTADESAVIVAETGLYQLSRVSIGGTHAGRREVIAGNLPGLPDNISLAPGGLIWVALAAPRDPTLDRVSAMHPALRKLIWRIPERLQPRVKRTVWAIAIDENGEIVRDLQTTRDDFHMATGVVEHDDHLYLSSFAETGLLAVDLNSRG